MNVFATTVIFGLVFAGVSIGLYLYLTDGPVFTTKESTKK